MKFFSCRVCTYRYLSSWFFHPNHILHEAQLINFFDKKTYKSCFQQLRVMPSCYQFKIQCQSEIQNYNPYAVSELHQPYRSHQFKYTFKKAMTEGCLTIIEWTSECFINTLHHKLDSISMLVVTNIPLNIL